MIPEPEHADLPGGALPGCLPAGELVLEGRVMPASNATFVGRIAQTQVVYKPIAGERPLWDFPGAVLAERERAAFLVSQATGWDVVPVTELREGPHGLGMVQLWCEPDVDQAAVDLVAAGESPEGYLEVFEGLDGADRPVSLIHEDSDALRRIAVFDIVINNADRKGGHVLEMPGGHRYGIDHGIGFHVEHKLRTVLWGWSGQSLRDEEIAGVEAVRAALRAELGAQLDALLPAIEIQALLRRCERLLRSGVFPQPREWPAIPWPPF